MSCRFPIRVLPGSALAALPAIVMLGLATPASASCGGEYTVQSGDTLSAIAARCDSSVDALIEANPQITSPSRLSIGWSLNVPDDQGMSSTDEVAAVEIDPGEPLSLEGRIVNGRRCAILETLEGEEYGMVSPELSFRSGRFVAVSGRMVDDGGCDGARTLLVSELNEVDA